MSLKPIVTEHLKSVLGGPLFLCHAYLQSMQYGWESKRNHVINLLDEVFKFRIHPPEHFKRKYAVDAVKYVDEVS